jgi:hypothetical protein
MATGLSKGGGGSSWRSSFSSHWASVASKRCRASHSRTSSCSSHPHIVPNGDLSQLALAGAEASAVQASASMSAATCVLVSMGVCVLAGVCVVPKAPRLAGRNGTLSDPELGRLTLAV